MTPETEQVARLPLGLRVAETVKVDTDLRDAIRHAALEDLRNGNPHSVLDAALYGTRFEPGPPALADCEGRRWHVVIPVRGRHDLLAECLRGLDRLRDLESFDVTLVCPADEYDGVEDCCDGAAVDTTVLPTAIPLGFAAACNAGTRGFWLDEDRVLYLNSDTDPERLGGLAEAFDTALDLADAAGPSGSVVSGFQMVHGPEPSPRWFAGLARAIPAPVPRLVGFALAVNLGAFRAVGGWDESYGLGNFDDDDLCLRLALNSSRPLRLAWVSSAFVRHVGSASFAALPDAQAVYARLMSENRVRFEERWGWAKPAILDWWRTL